MEKIVECCHCHNTFIVEKAKPLFTVGEYVQIRGNGRIGKIRSILHSQAQLKETKKDYVYKVLVYTSNSHYPCLYLESELKKVCPKFCRGTRVRIVSGTCKGLQGIVTHHKPMVVHNLHPDGVLYNVVIRNVLGRGYCQSIYCLPESLEKVT